MQHPFPFDPDWQEKYRDMIATPAEAVGRLRAGNRVFVGTGCGTPTVLVEALVKRAHELADVEIIHLLTMGDAPYADRKLTECFLVNSFFIGANIRSHIQEGLGDYTPIMLIDIPHLFDSGQIPLDAVLIQVTPPDIHGKVSLGVSVDIVKSAAENGSLVIAQVNPRMPRTMGDSFLDVADLDVLVPAERELLEIPPPELDRGHAPDRRAHRGPRRGRLDRRVRHRAHPARRSWSSSRRRRTWASTPRCSPTASST